MQDDWLYAGLLKENGYPSPCLLQLMRDIVTGLKDLHSLSIIHGDMKPSRVLILEDRALVSGMGSSRRLDEGKSSLGPNSTISGTIGWRSPEQILKLPQTPAMDFFTLGCVLFFILTKGKHPFGDDLPDREINVVNNNIVNLFLVEHIPVVKDLVSRLLKFEPELRPKASEVLGHPLFWNHLKRLQFLIDVRGRVECSKEEKDRSIVAALESKSDVVFSEYLENDAFITEMKKKQVVPLAQSSRLAPFYVQNKDTGSNEKASYQHSETVGTYAGRA